MNQINKFNPVMSRGFTERHSMALDIYYKGISKNDNLREAIFLLSGLFWYGDKNAQIPAYRQDDYQRRIKIIELLKRTSPELQYYLMPGTMENIEFEKILDDQVSRRQVTPRKRRVLYDSTYRDRKILDRDNWSELSKVKQQKGNRKKKMISEHRIAGFIDQYVQEHGKFPSIRQIALKAKTGVTQASSGLECFKKNYPKKLDSIISQKSMLVTPKAPEYKAFSVLNKEIRLNSKNFYLSFFNTYYLYKNMNTKYNIFTRNLWEKSPIPLKIGRLGVTSIPTIEDSENSPQEYVHVFEEQGIICKDSIDRTLVRNKITKLEYWEKLWKRGQGLYNSGAVEDLKEFEKNLQVWTNSKEAWIYQMVVKENVEDEYTTSFVEVFNKRFPAWKSH